MRLDPRPLFDRAVILGGQVIAGVRPDQLGGRTPCRYYSVRQLMGHMIDGLRRVAALGRGDDPFGMPPLDVAGVFDGEWLTLWRLAAHEVEQAWADPEVLTRTLTLPWAALPGADQLLTYTNEVTVHTWDLAAATGQAPVWDGEVVAAALTAIRRALPAEADQRIGTPFDKVVDIPADSPLIDQLVAWNGREP